MSHGDGMSKQGQEPDEADNRDFLDAVEQEEAIGTVGVWIIHLWWAITSSPIPGTWISFWIPVHPRWVGPGWNSGCVDHPLVVGHHIESHSRCVDLLLDSSAP
jgi:hypothetical protein